MTDNQEKRAKLCWAERPNGGWEVRKMTDQQREGIGMAFTEGQREAVQIWQRASKLDGGDDVTFNQLKAVLEAANYWKLRKAAKQALEDITAYRRLNSLVPADVPDGPTEKALRAALKGGGEIDT